MRIPTLVFMAVLCAAAPAIAQPAPRAEIDRAIASQRKAVALAPDNTIYRDNLAELERARTGGTAKLDTRFSLGD